MEPLSPLLSTMFQQHNCCNCSGSYCGRRETIQIHLPDIKKETLKCVLDVIYTGKANPSMEGLLHLEGLLKLLDVKLPGLNSVLDSEKSVVSSQSNRKLSNSSSKGYILDEESPATVPEPEKSMVKSPSHLHSLHVEMARKLIPFEENKRLDCNVPGCSEKVTPQNVTSHFLKHVNDCESKMTEQKNEIILFKCKQCAKKFKFRRALDQHKKTTHLKADALNNSVKNPSPPIDYTLPMKHATNEVKSKFVCQYCKKETKSEWHLTPSRHKCPLLDMIEASKLARVNDVQSTGSSEVASKRISCKQCGKTVQSSWHLNPFRHKCFIKQEIVESSETGQDNIKCELCGTVLKSIWYLNRHTCGGRKDNLNGYEDQVHECKVCNSKHDDLSTLVSHYTREHYWEKLKEEFSTWLTRCSICLLEFPNNEHLVYHMGNFHRKFQKYLQQDGHDFFQLFGRFKLERFICGIESCGRESQNLTQLKLHLSTSHFPKKLSREFPEGGHSPCISACPKIFPNEAKRLYHIGSTHNECLKFAALDFKEDELSFSTFYDLEALRMGVIYEKEDQKRMKGKRPKFRFGAIKPAGWNNYSCGKCKKAYRTRIRLKYHLAFYHYKDKLMKTYAGTVCGICEKVCESNQLLLRHVAFKHDSVIAYLLGKEGLLLPRKLKKNEQVVLNVKPEDEESEQGNVSYTPEVPFVSVKMEPIDDDDDTSKKNERLPEAFLNKQCQICLKEFQNNYNLRVHYVSVHYSKMVPEDPDSIATCSVCSTYVEPKKGSLKGGMFNHYAVYHWDILLEHMEEDKLWVAKSKIFSLGDNGYNVKKLKINIKMTEEVKQKAEILIAKKLKSKKMKKKKLLQDSFQIKLNSQISIAKPSEPKLPLVELMTCFLCKKDFNESGQNTLLSHFSKEHYRLELEHNYITRPGMTWATDKRCPQCFKIVETKQDLIYHIGVEHRAVEKFLPEKYRLPTIIQKDLSFPCPLKNCSSDKETKKALLVHLLIIHYQADMEKEFAALFKQEEKKKCPMCNMGLLDNYLGYMKHIAVEHAYVMNFVKRDINEDNIKRDDNEQPLTVDSPVDVGNNKHEQGETTTSEITTINSSFKDSVPQNKYNERNANQPETEHILGVEEEKTNNGTHLLNGHHPSVDTEDRKEKGSTKQNLDDTSSFISLDESLTSLTESKINPFFKESESQNKTAKQDLEVVPNLLQFEAVASACQVTPSKENTPIVNGMSEIVLVNEAQSGSPSPASSAGSTAKGKQFVSFDLRAILDSDSD